ncbi:MAG TPA: class F sortase [Actinocrinis sp.]|nr:class F sortase [Actinocrinis sp.]
MSPTNHYYWPGGSRRGTRTAAAAVTLALTGAGVLTYALLSTSPQPPLPTAAQSGTLSLPVTGAQAAQPLALAASQPEHVTIPSIGVDASVGALGLNADGTVQVPDEPASAGWYTGSASPGQVGAAVLLGHVDFMATGPAVFYDLGALKPGAQITVTRADGSTPTFTVTAVREFPKSEFPTAEVYEPNANAAQLRLITCGSWDSDQHAYTGNTVVFATLTALTDQPAAAPTPAPTATDQVPFHARTEMEPR